MGSEPDRHEEVLSGANKTAAVRVDDVLIHQRDIAHVGQRAMA